MFRYPIVLTIAGSDPSGGAGIQADIKTISALGGYAASVITAVTVQNTCGVQSVFPLPASVVEGQLRAVLDDLHVQAVKIGMLQDAAIIRTIASVLREYRPAYVVLDPVMVSSSGHPLLSEEAFRAMVDELFPLATLITPNLPEAEALLTACSPESFPADPKGQFVWTAEKMEQAAGSLLTCRSEAVLLKGGHLEGDERMDVLAVRTGEGAYRLSRFTHNRIDTQNTHGTGCTLSSAIATGLAKGYSLEKSVAAAKEYLSCALEAGRNVRVGKGHGPADFFFAPSPSLRMGLLKIIVITWPEFLPDEAATLTTLFQSGLERLHLRKPQASAEELEELIRQIPAEYYSRMVLHDHFQLAVRYGLGGVHLNRRNPSPPPAFKGTVSCSCHSLEEVEMAKRTCNYVSLSPVFDSISKTGYRSAFTPESLHEALVNGIIDDKVMALGGVDCTNIRQVQAMGFGGAMILGEIWCTSDGDYDGSEAVERFKALTRSV